MSDENVKHKVIEIAIKNRVYKIACDEEEKELLYELSESFSNRVREVDKKTGQKANDTTIFLIAAMDLENQNRELKTKIKSMNVKLEEYKCRLNEASLREEDIVKRVTARLVGFKKYLKEEMQNYSANTTGTRQTAKKTKAIDTK